MRDLSMEALRARTAPRSKKNDTPKHPDGVERETPPYGATEPDGVEFCIHQERGVCWWCRDRRAAGTSSTTPDDLKRALWLEAVHELYAHGVEDIPAALEGPRDEIWTRTAWQFREFLRGRVRAALAERAA